MIEDVYREHMVNLQELLNSVMMSVAPAINIAEKEMRGKAPGIIFDTLVEGANAALDNRGNFTVALEGNGFNQTNPAAREYAATRSGVLVANVADRQAVRAAIVSTFDGDLTPGQAARRIRSSIGLTTKQSRNVATKFANLVNSGVSRNVALARSEKFANKLIRDRARTIARTETISAANEGQRQLWLQNISDGLLTGREQREWIVTPDDRLCPICIPMDGVKVGMKEDFLIEETGESVKGPPAHANCRCAVGLFIPPRTQ